MTSRPDISVPYSFRVGRSAACAILARHREEELDLLARLREEMGRPELYPAARP